MEIKWFSQTQANGMIRHRMFKRNSPTGAWAETPYFIDQSKYTYQYTFGQKYGLFGSGMGELVASASVPYRIAACFGGYSRLSEAKFDAEKKLLENNKKYNVKYGVGSAKYLVSFHDGLKTHNDGSPFYDIKIFKNKKLLGEFLKSLNEQGYKEEGVL